MAVGAGVRVGCGEGVGKGVSVARGVPVGGIGVGVGVDFLAVQAVSKAKIHMMNIALRNIRISLAWLRILVSTKLFFFVIDSKIAQPR